MARRPAGQDSTGLFAPGTVTVPLGWAANASAFWIILLLVSGRMDHRPIGVKAQCEGRPSRRGCCAHNRLVASSSPASPTTQSRANAVSCGLCKNPRFCVTFARVGAAFPVSAPETRDSTVSAARNRPVTPKMPRQSLASLNFFPARIGGAHRDWFDSLQRSVRVSHGQSGITEAR
jgi:hypothetical protein